MLGFLEFTAAFNTVDHKVLLGRLKVRYAVGYSVLAWFLLTEREENK